MKNLGALLCLVAFASSGARAQDAVKADAPVARPPPLRGPLHLSAFGFGELLGLQLGAELGAGYSLGQYLDLGASVLLGTDIGYRLNVTLHPGTNWNLRPFLQLRGIVHPGRGGVGAGAGALLGASLELGPGRVAAGLAGEWYPVRPDSYRPFGVLISLGYEVDLFRPVDTDGDGIRDSEDKCPNEPETFNGIEDADGCPDGAAPVAVAEADRDGDGIVDSKDKCPNEPEDMDGFEDEDGCPDLDNDHDGIPDTVDKCPNAAEDKDGFEDSDGCPDPDNDGDGIPDVNDKCPNEPETFNGIDDADGCPEKDATAFIEKTTISTRIVIKDRVFFQTSSHKILSRSFGILTNVAEILKRFPQIKKLRIEGHTDDVGTDDSNLKLSTRRSQAVMGFLVLKGIEPERLAFEGYGKTRPLVPGDTAEAREANRRVEFVIVDPPEFVAPR